MPALAKVVCAQCKRPLIPARFAIARYNNMGKMTYSLQLCSVLCVGRWALQFGIGGVRNILKQMSK
jgi:hypothetical protein